MAVSVLTAMVNRYAAALPGLMLSTFTTPASETARRPGAAPPQPAAIPVASGLNGRRQGWSGGGL